MRREIARASSTLVGDFLTWIISWIKRDAWENRFYRISSPCGKNIRSGQQIPVATVYIYILDRHNNYDLKIFQDKRQYRITEKWQKNKKRRREREEGEKELEEREREERVAEREAEGRERRREKWSGMERRETEQSGEERREGKSGRGEERSRETEKTRMSASARKLCKTSLEVVTGDISKERITSLILFMTATAEVNELRTADMLVDVTWNASKPVARNSSFLEKLSWESSESIRIWRIHRRTDWLDEPFGMRPKSTSQFIDTHLDVNMRESWKKQIIESSSSSKMRSTACPDAGNGLVLFATGIRGDVRTHRRSADETMKNRKSRHVRFFHSSHVSRYPT